MIATASWVPTRMAEAADGPAGAAIDVAEMLVERGTPFRQAHAIVGGLVADSTATGRRLEDLIAEHPLLGEDAVRLLLPGVPVTNRTTAGGAGPSVVGPQLERLAIVLDGEAAAIEALPGR
jgi:argininosuccinate lyase